MHVMKEAMLLYAVTDRHWLKDETLYSQVERALKGGVTFVQLREKGADIRAILPEARRIRELCRSYGVPFVVDDSVELALAVDADGVHVGQNDRKPDVVREMMGADKIVGVTARTVGQALCAQKSGADYLGVGAVFRTDTKADACEISHDTLREICAAVTIPVVAIGGITQENVLKLKGTGIDGIAVISAIFAQEDITKAASQLKEKVREVIDG